MKWRGMCLLLAGVLGVAVVLGGCSSAASTEDSSVEPAATEPSVDDAQAALLDVDTSAVPDGATVDQLVTIDEAREIIGIPEVFFAVPAG